MAKALFGHTSPLPDVRLLDEVGRLHRRLRELDRELAEARADNERMAAQLQMAQRELDHVRLADDELLRLSQLEHASI